MTQSTPTDSAVAKPPEDATLPAPQSPVGIDSTTSSRPENADVEEFKIWAEEARFAMTRYMQTFALYFALVGFSAKEMFERPFQPSTLALSLLITVFNGVGLYGVRHFGAMIGHARDRQAELAAKLQYKVPYSAEWGRHIGLAALLLIQILIDLVVLNYVTGTFG